MPVVNFAAPRGRIEEIPVDSEALRGNLLGDPARRRVAVYLPEGYPDDGPYPVFVDLVGFLGSGLSHLGFKAFRETVPQRLDRLVAEGKMGPVVAVFPDCFTSLGGNQYVDSLAMGNWATFLLDEMLPAVEGRYDTGPRAVFGKSSGGYGAIAHGLRYGDRWDALACHSGDMAFELCYASWFPKALERIAKHGGIGGFLDHVRTATKLDDGELHDLMTLAMAATYDPDPGAPMGVRLPVDLDTGALDEAAWARWKAHDPVVLARDPANLDRLRGMKGVYVDCGSTDQYALVYGARQLRDRLRAAGVPHHYEEFPDNHSDVDYRMDVSLPWLYAAVTG